MIVGTYNYFHVALNMPNDVDWKAVEVAIEAKCEDWIRYSGNCYLVWTNEPVATLAGSILSVSGMSQGSFLIVKVVMEDGFGWLPQWVWDWIHKVRTPQLSGLAQMLPKPPTS